ncbi:hypothetical protein EAG_03105 [Camponotus floridanus]|uniref:Uncharacterized protein n=1 Tax=Camponotus floridanus TaxID=104421 RepID=E2ATH1_CAMFO|nr:hypothetical protein EAG_03105 [Camponotus floridanus]
MERVSRQGNASAVNEQTLIFSRTKTHHPYRHPYHHLSSVDHEPAPYALELEEGKSYCFPSDKNLIITKQGKNPNIMDHHGRNDTLLPASREKSRFRTLSWEQYDPVHQKYLEIDLSGNSYKNSDSPIFHQTYWFESTKIVINALRKNLVALIRILKREEKIFAVQMQFTDKVALFGRRGMLYFIVSMSADGTTLAVLTTATTFVHKNKEKLLWDLFGFGFVRFPLLSSTKLALSTQPSMSSITIDRKDDAFALPLTERDEKLAPAEAVRIAVSYSLDVSVDIAIVKRRNRRIMQELQALWTVPAGTSLGTPLQVLAPGIKIFRVLEKSGNSQLSPKVVALWENVSDKSSFLFKEKIKYVIVHSTMLNRIDLENWRAKSTVIRHHIEILSFASSCNHPAEIPRNSLHPVQQARTRNSKFKSVADAGEYRQIQGSCDVPRRTRQTRINGSILLDGGLGEKMFPESGRASHEPQKTSAIFDVRKANRGYSETSRYPPRYQLSADPVEFACAGNGIPCRRQKRDRCIEFGGVASDYKDANVLVEERTQEQQQQQQGRINARSKKGWRRGLTSVASISEVPPVLLDRSNRVTGGQISFGQDSSWKQQYIMPADKSICKLVLLIDLNIRSTACIIKSLHWKTLCQCQQMLSRGKFEGVYR